MREVLFTRLGSDIGLYDKSYGNKSAASYFFKCFGESMLNRSHFFANIFTISNIVKLRNPPLRSVPVRVARECMIWRYVFLALVAIPFRIRLDTLSFFSRSEQSQRSESRGEIRTKKIGIQSRTSFAE